MRIVLPQNSGFFIFFSLFLKSFAWIKKYGDITISIPKKLPTKYVIVPTKTLWMCKYPNKNSMLIPSNEETVAPMSNETKKDSISEISSNIL